ncbi:UDP-N-acetylglucosamine transferase subunit ALG13 [Acetitomaculum ruminis DSM 5522]|uniref:UDP-N-acetylglucosamine transferase subunit ALG13 n=1 Tax=Acetitomaculum ruminis DSM 5522 TaxID=1120918 RepID=A0A1I0Z0V5_9FIRM|nr:PssE/Cps14G family polysaccharide biosynthesis glycosyltransferase [Acetitomaculum ruminis]SFB19042.1 UDP-N-acetylglucosamine transferase subunit ALG13 [Acetitomaculum ruminis DSM 5522]
MIFVTLGSQKFQFNRLLKALDDLVDRGIINEEIYAQKGASDYVPKNYKSVDFLDRDRFEEMTLKSDIVITHGGTGAIIGAVKKGKKVIAVPRLERYGEHVDDHQLQLLRQFDDLGIICACYDTGKLKECYEEVLSRQYRPYVSNTNTIIDSIEEYLDTLK